MSLAMTPPKVFQSRLQTLMVASHLLSGFSGPGFLGNALTMRK
jgi:hypothetical protein